MSPEPAPDKRELRRQLRGVLKTLATDAVRAASLNAQTRLREQPAWQQARAVLFYAPLANEINLTPLLEEGLRSGKEIALPRFINDTGAYEACQIHGLAGDGVPGRFGIVEPGLHCASFPLKRLDLVLAPGLGFDLTGRRLGRGQGFYDRLLAQFKGTKCGVAFDEQIVPRVPGEAHDVRVNFILTPTRWVVTSAEVF